VWGYGGDEEVSGRAGGMWSTGSTCETTRRATGEGDEHVTRVTVVDKIPSHIQPTLEQFNPCILDILHIYWEFRVYHSFGCIMRGIGCQGHDRNQGTCENDRTPV